jgi:hypothetical protein
MKLHEQREVLTAAVYDARRDLQAMHDSVRRKVAAPYGDGSKSNMVNAETDVLPRLMEIIRSLDATTSRLFRE